MKKKISIISLFFTILCVGHIGVASISDDQGGYYEFDEANAPNFFLEDANELAIPFSASLPSMMPCNGVITSDYGLRRIGRRRARMHLGIDIAAPKGSPVLAPADGKVAFAGYKGGYGLAVVIDHGGELTTLYGHNSKLFVTEGDMVKKGQEISLVGSTGHSTGPHVHYEVRVEGNPINPSRFF